MSDEHRDLYYHTHFQNDQLSPFMSAYYNPLGFDSNPYMSLTHNLHESMDYNSLSPSSSEVFSSIEGHHKPMDLGDVGGGNSNEIPVTPNSSMSSASTDAGPDDDSGKCKKEEQLKGSDDGGESSKKVSKTKKKTEKRKIEPRFAFMTKSEVDHLEDGYRWRKYGQKAVKNSSYPRSYYRCTTQKCTVKKRVERSFEDPSIVITTYEGQHTHPLPSTLRGNMTGLYSSSSMLTQMPAPTFPQQWFLQMPSHQDGLAGAISDSHNQSLQQHHHHHQLPDYGLLQDIVPSMFLKQEP